MMIGKLLGSACVGALLMTAGGALAAPTVKVGFLATLSGPGGALGQDQYDAFMLGIEDAKAKLGDIQIEVVKQDDQLKPDLAVQEAKELIQSDKVQIITGVTFSNVMMAVYKPITDAGVFLVGSNAGPSPLSGKDCTPLLFVSSWNNDSLHESMGKYATEAGFKNVYLLAPNYQAGKDAISGFKRFYTGKAADEVYTQVNQLDYSSEIAEIQAAKPDAVYVFYPGGMGVNFVKQYQQAGLLGKLPLLSTSTVDGTTLPALKQIAVGAVTGSPYSPDLDNPANKQFVAGFTKRTGRSPSLYAAQSYDAAQLIASALVKTKGDVADKKAFEAALAAADFTSVAGPFSFNTNHFPVRNFYRVDVVKDAAGNATFANKGVVLANHKDAYASQCKMP